MGVAALQAGANPPAVRRSVTAGLAVALTGLTGAAVLSAGWTDGSVSAVCIGVAGALEALALAVLRVPRVVALVAPLLLLAVTVMVPTIGTVPVPAHSNLGTVLGHYLAAAVSGLLGNAQWDFNVGLGTLLWACGAWTTEMALRGRRGAVATAPVWAVLAVNVINAPTPANAALTSLLAAVTAVLLIAAVHLQRLSASWSRRGVTVLPGTDRRFAVAGAAGGVIVLLLAVVLPPLTSTDISASIFSIGGGTGGVGRPGGGADLSGTVRFSRATVPGGPLTDVTLPVLTYITGVPSGAYLQMATDSVFASGTWLPAQDQESADLIAETDQPGPIERDRLLSDGGVGADVQQVVTSVLVSNDTSGDNTLPFPGEPDASSVTARVSGLSVLGSLSGFLTVDTAQATSSVVGRAITTTGTQSAATVDQLRAAGNSYPDFITSGGFLDLHDDGTGGVQVIQSLAAQWTRNATNAYDQATAIENTLRNPQLFQYTLDPPLPPPGAAEWPIVYFLTTGHAGYCQYFASTMGAMLRALGIPARLVNGYGPGTVSDSAITAGGAGLVRRVTTDDAHTWVEAYFPTYGWVPFEPTPPSTQGNYLPFARGGGSAAPSTPSSAPRSPAHGPTKAGGRGALADNSPSSGGGGSSGGYTGLAGAAGAALLALALLMAVWLSRPRGLPGVWRRLGLVGRLLGAPRDTSLTFDEYVARLTAALPTGRGRRNLRQRVEVSLEEICVLSDRAMYAREAPSGADLLRVRRAWRGIARLVPALGWRALVRRGAPP